jgi:GNAT superfamily N-acetyltransferase
VLAQAADRRQFIWVAVDESGTIVGFVSGGPPQEKFEGYTSELYAIYLLRSVQGQGIGRHLVERLAQDLWADGHRTMTVGVLAENPGRLFYERLGAKLLKEYSIARGGKELLERYYGWDDLSVLLP